MTFFPVGKHAAPDTIRGISHNLLHINGCNVCPLNHQVGFRPVNPRMPAYGSPDPRVYILGEAPGKDEDLQGRAFVGAAGALLRKFLPYRWEDTLRWNNVVRTRPKGNATPSTMAVECCRPSIVADIEQSKPEAIFGFGAIPLEWATKETGIRKWNGRRIPIKVGKHACWYYPMLHPSYVLQLNNEATQKLYEQMAFVFEMDIRRAFKEVENGLPDPIIHTREDAERDIDLLYSVEAIRSGLNDLMKEPYVGFDLETVGTRPYATDACILSASLSGKDRTIAFPLYHKEARWTDSERTAVEDAMIKFFREYEGDKISFFLNFELEWMGYFYGEDLIHAGNWRDAHAQAFLLDGRQGTLSLDFVCYQYFGLSIKAITNTDVTKLDSTALDIVLLYNGIDSKYHRLSHETQQDLLEQRDLLDVYDHHCRRTQAAVLMQIKGAPVSQKVNKALTEKYETKMKEIEQQISQTELAQKFKRRYGHNYRPTAPADTRKIFQMIGVSLSNTQEEEIEKIDHPLAKMHIEWKGANKIMSTYISRLQANNEDTAIWPDGLLHPTLKLTTVRTWRSSCMDVNLQNYPKHFGDAHEVRDQVEAPPGYKIVSVDYGQIQARNVAMESKDHALVKSFWDRHDIHNDWRDRIFELYPKWPKEGLKKVLADPKLMKFYRNRAKNGFVFASFFGAGGKKVAQTLGIPDDIGYQLAEEFDNAFPEMTQWHERLHADYDTYGYVTGLSEFRRYAPVAHTEVINTPIQSDEAIIVFDGMIRLCELQEPDLVPFMMIHDDLTFMWPDKKIERYAETVIDTLLNCPFEWSHIVPLSVEMSIGQSWDSMKEVSSYGPLESDKWTGKLKKVEAKK